MGLWRVGMKITKRKLKRRWQNFTVYLNFQRSLHYSVTHTSPNEVVWIVGDGRSGTTWCSKLVNNRKQYRYMFEPFHPTSLPWLENFKKFQYIRSHDSSKKHLIRGNAIFNGQLQHPRINRHNQYENTSGLLIKDIHAHLFLNWVDVQFSHVKKVMILRHPCAVALSKLKLNKWNWPQDPEIFFSQAALCEDYLGGFGHLLEKATTQFERYILTWSILHFVPLQQLSRGRLHLVFYEELCTNPERELGRLFTFLGEPTDFDSELREIVATPSPTSRGHSAIVAGKDLISGWRKELSNEQIDSAMTILASFGLNKIYSEQLSPDIGQAERFLDVKAGAR